MLSKISITTVLLFMLGNNVYAIGLCQEPSLNELLEKDELKGILSETWGYDNISDKQIKNARIIIEEAESLGVEPSLALAISMKESSLKMVNNKDARGLFQLNGITRKALNISTYDASYSPRKNAQAGIYYLTILRDKYGYSNPKDIMGASFLGPNGWRQKGYRGVDSQGTSGHKHVNKAFRYYKKLKGFFNRKRQEAKQLDSPVSPFEFQAIHPST